MFTKNFYNVLATTLYKKFMPITDTKGSAHSATATYGNVSTSSSSFFWGGHIYQWASTIYADGVFFGTGTTAPTMTDYKPESILGSDSISVTAPSTAVAIQTGNCIEVNATFMVTNISSSAITISEIGYLAYNLNSSIGESSPPYLAERQLLEMPITLEANETEAILYRVRLPYGA